MDLQVFDWDTIRQFHVTDSGIEECTSKYCSRGHLFGLYDNGKFLGHSTEDIAISTTGEKLLVN
jgi:hypothetical protein